MSPRLENRIHTFHSKLDTMMEGIENCLCSQLNRRIFQQIHILMMMKILMDGRHSPRHLSIFMPSSLQFADIQRLGLVTMASQEL